MQYLEKNGKEETMVKKGQGIFKQLIKQNGSKTHLMVYESNTREETLSPTTTEHNTGMVPLNHWCDFQQLPQNRANWKGQLFWPASNLYHHNQSGNISVPMESSGCLREEEAVPYPDQLLHPTVHRSALQMLMSASVGKKRGPEAETPAGTASLCHGTGSGAHQTTAQENRFPLLSIATPLPCCSPPTHTGIGIGSRSQAHVAGGCVSADLTAQLGLNTGISGVSHFISSFSTALVYNERNPLVIWQFQLLCTSDPISSFIYPDCYGMLVCWLYTSTSSVLI